jgi:hypothetical protein
MKLKTLSTREQVLVLVVAIVLVGGGYGALRALPAMKSLKAMAESTGKNEQRIRTTEIPELPDEDEDSMQRDIRETEASLARIQGGMHAVDERLAPADSQELKLRISGLAQQSGVFIIENKAFVPTALLQSSAAAPARKSKRARKAAAAAAAQTAQPVIPAVLPESEGLVARMAPGTPLHRPMQQLGMEGDFEGMRNFIQGLDRLPWQVTIVQFKLEAKPVDPPAGMPQRLSANLILAL